LKLADSLFERGEWHARALDTVTAAVMRERDASIRLPQQLAGGRIDRMALPRMSPKNAAICVERLTGPTIGMRKPACAWNDQCTHPVVASSE
jgi:hypothetical protein